MLTNPAPSYTFDVDSAQVIDADTIRVTVSRTFDIRIKDVDAPEKRTPEGKDAIEFVKNELKDVKEMTVVVPLNDSHKLMDINSFGRLVGEFWYDGTSLRDALINNGHVKRKNNVK